MPSHLELEPQRRIHQQYDDQQQSKQQLQTRRRSGSNVKFFLVSLLLVAVVSNNNINHHCCWFPCAVANVRPCFMVQQQLSQQQRRRHPFLFSPLQQPKRLAFHKDARETILTMIQKRVKSLEDETNELNDDDDYDSTTNRKTTTTNNNHSAIDDKQQQQQPTIAKRRQTSFNGWQPSSSSSSGSSEMTTINNSNDSDELQTTAKRRQTSWNGWQPKSCSSTSDSSSTGNSKDNNNNNLVNLPRHVAIVCDGNARWAAERSLPTVAGHVAGANRLVGVLQSLQAFHIPVCTLFGFSTENWNRSPTEIQDIFNVMERTAQQLYPNLLQDGSITVNILGEWQDDRIPESLRIMLRKIQETTTTTTSQQQASSSKNKKKNPLTLCIAINYGGQQDILQATKRLCQLAQQGQLDHLLNDNDNNKNNDFSSLFQSSLSTAGLPDPDLIIRTSGEYRLSNFFLYTAAYSELYFTNVYWPDFDAVELQRALQHYQTRKRRFGARRNNCRKDEQEKKDDDEDSTTNTKDDNDNNTKNTTNVFI